MFLKLNTLKISTYNIESTATTPTPTPTTTPMLGFYLIPESVLRLCEIWICSLFYLYMYVCILVLFWCYLGVILVLF